MGQSCYGRIRGIDNMHIDFHKSQLWMAIEWDNELAWLNAQITQQRRLALDSLELGVTGTRSSKDHLTLRRVGQKQLLNRKNTPASYTRLQAMPGEADKWTRGHALKESLENPSSALPVCRLLHLSTRRLASLRAR
jgi:hypothetical protein